MSKTRKLDTSRFETEHRNLQSKHREDINIKRPRDRCNILKKQHDEMQDQLLDKDKKLDHYASRMKTLAESSELGNELKAKDSSPTDIRGKWYDIGAKFRDAFGIAGASLVCNSTYIEPVMESHLQKIPGKTSQDNGEWLVNFTERTSVRIAGRVLEGVVLYSFIFQRRFPNFD